jgi:hypothetical protein
MVVNISLAQTVGAALSVVKLALHSTAKEVKTSGLELTGSLRQTCPYLALTGNRQHYILPMKTNL